MRSKGYTNEQITALVNTKMKEASFVWDHRNLIGENLAVDNSRICGQQKPQVKAVYVNKDAGPREAALRKLRKKYRQASLPALTPKRQLGQSMPTTDELDRLDRVRFTGETFTTTNQNFFHVNAPVDFKHYRKNFKKKTPLTQWSNAYFSGGVHFNPPGPGI